MVVFVPSFQLYGQGLKPQVALGRRGTKTQKGQENGHKRAFRLAIYANLMVSHRSLQALVVRHFSRRANSEICK